jgi:hypothetical protein
MVMVRMTPAGERLEAVRFASDPAVLAEQIAKAGPYRALLRIPGIGPVFAAILRGRDR